MASKMKILAICETCGRQDIIYGTGWLSRMTYRPFMERLVQAEQHECEKRPPA